MPISNPEFLELCGIIVERNRLAKLRSYYRHKERRLNELKEAIVHNYELKKLKRLANATIPNKHKKLLELENRVFKVMQTHNGWRVRNLIKQDKEHLLTNQAEVKLDIEEMGEFKDLPKKYAKTTQGDIRILLMELDVEYSKVKLDIALFTRQTRKTVRKILKKHNIRMSEDGNSGIAGIWITGEDGARGFLGRETIQKAHEDNMFEKEILGAS